MVGQAARGRVAAGGAGPASQLLGRGLSCHPRACPSCDLSCPLVSTVGYGSWFEHVQEFWEHHMDSNVLFLKYEDMHRVSAWGGAPVGGAWGGASGACPEGVGAWGRCLGDVS